MKVLAKLSVVWIMAACTITAAWSQGVTWAEVLKGEKVRLAYPLKELPKQYQAVQISLRGGSGGILESMFGAMAGALGSLNSIAEPKDSSQIAALLMMIHLTAGEELQIGAQVYVVTYKLGLKETAKVDPTSGPPKSSDLEWHVSFVNAADIAQLTPLPKLSVPDALSKLEAMPRTGAPDSPPDDVPIDAGLSSADEARALANVKQMALAVMMYAADNDDLFPGAQSTATARAVVMPYLKSSDVMKTLNPNGGQLLYNVGLASVSMSAIEEIGTTILFYDSQPWPSGGRPVAFADSSARWTDRDAWAITKGSLMKTFPRAGGLLPMNHMVDEDPLRLQKGS